MQPLRKLFDIKPLRLRKIRIELDRQCDNTLGKIGDSENRFIRNFFSQLANCGKVDVYEFVSAVSDRETLFVDAKKMFDDNSKLDELYKWFCLYNVLRFCRSSKGDDMKCDAAIQSALRVFELSKAERDEFEHFLELQTRNASIFELEFSSYILKYIFLMDNSGRRAHAFVNCFIYEAYDGFLKSFTNYVPMKSILYSTE